MSQGHNLQTLMVARAYLGPHFELILDTHLAHGQLKAKMQQLGNYSQFLPFLFYFVLL